MFRNTNRHGLACFTKCALRQRAAKASPSSFSFIPWFWQPEYRKLIPELFTATADEIAYQQAYGLDLEQMVWRRAKVIELNGIHNFRRE